MVGSRGGGEGGRERAESEWEGGFIDCNRRYGRKRDLLSEYKRPSIPVKKRPGIQVKKT